MDVFSFDDHLLAQYTAFARSFTRIRASEIQNKVDELYAGRRFWPEPLIQLNPHYEGGGSIQALVGLKGLIVDCAQIFRGPRPDPADSDKSLKLRRHQEQAIATTIIAVMSIMIPLAFLLLAIGVAITWRYAHRRRRQAYA